MRAARLSRGSEEHISGAETLVASKTYLPAEASRMVRRAESHPRGMPDRIIVTVERILGSPREISALPLATLDCRSPAEARRSAEMMLLHCGVSRPAIRSAFGLLRSPLVMRGACLMRAETGARCEPDPLRGVRASRLGLAPEAGRRLAQRLGRRGINTDTVRDALTLASKVSSCPGIVAEICVSDDPGYTVGYVASPSLGYVRIPSLKRTSDRRGGRVFFVKEDADLPAVVSYLEQTPVLVTRPGRCRGELSLDELIGRHHR